MKDFANHPIADFRQQNVLWARVELVIGKSFSHGWLWVKLNGSSVRDRLPCPQDFFLVKRCQAQQPWCPCATILDLADFAGTMPGPVIATKYQLALPTAA